MARSSASVISFSGRNLPPSAISGGISPFCQAHSTAPAYHSWPITSSNMSLYTFVGKNFSAWIIMGRASARFSGSSGRSRSENSSSCAAGAFFPRILSGHCSTWQSFPGSQYPKPPVSAREESFSNAAALCASASSGSPSRPVFPDSPASPCATQPAA